MVSLPGLADVVYSNSCFEFSCEIYSTYVDGVFQKICRDPRFDDLSGDFREEVFHRDYAFISELENRDKQVEFIVVVVGGRGVFVELSTRKMNVDVYHV